MFKKILIANRGEIAVRIIKACRDLGIPTVAVFSSSDRSALHTQFADEAIEIGPPSPLESYLNMDSIIHAAKKTGVDAVHPGYGFLAENHLFSARCRDEGVVFIGPTPEALKLVGDKIASRITVKKMGAPIIPGMTGTAKEKDVFIKKAKSIGYPVLVKASLGGGGKGMRVVNNDKALLEAIDAGRREAKSAFGDDTVYIEKYLEKPRHIEFQILADNYGTVIHLFERECSIQRRYQKIIEESPSTALDNNQRKKMGEIAIKIASVVGYTNAGTIEFLLDENKNFYFLEVNARIQVEHPVTEFVTGVDIVKQQIRIASGEKLKIKQKELLQRGHSVEARIYAEDSENNFLPSPGKIRFLQEPRGPGIRLDSGIYDGFEVSASYDPILSKLIVFDETRDAAINKMVNALSDYSIVGIKTTIAFLLKIFESPDFKRGNLHTSFISEHKEDLRVSTTKNLYEALAAYGIFTYSKGKSAYVEKEKGIVPVWESTGGWRSGE
ncbi:acetyl-CoA carboxylase biotin carboxylase subunit [candidate division WOR-3 bacterium]|nr:acetyl-CoA carboxylase biotin carboxylase subunit [candidate division WOR-3 bacterium]